MKPISKENNIQLSLNLLFFMVNIFSLTKLTLLMAIYMFDDLFSKINFILRYKKQTYQMEKQKLAEMVMQKMKQKKEQQQRNRPHYEVLRLQTTFNQQFHDQLKKQITQLQKTVNQNRKIQQELQSHLNEIDNTGKKNLPRIIIMPEFIASENIQADTKQFYRKSSNTFLRTDILRTKGYQQSIHIQKEFLQSMNAIRDLENTINKNEEQDRKITNEKRVKVLKQDLRLRSIRQQQRNLKKTIQQERQDNRELLKQYQIKKVNLQSRKDRLRYVTDQIEVYKKKIEETYNPITYRQHLKNLFAGQIKNQIMRGNLQEVTKNVQNVDKETKSYQKVLQKKTSLLILGRTSDSPSTKLGRIKNRLEQQRKKQPFQIHRSAGKQRNGSNSERSLSQNSIPRQKLKLDFSSIVHSSGKASNGTTDRSSHRRQLSSISRALF